MTDKASEKSVIDAAIAVAEAVEGNAMALIEAAVSVRQLVEHYRDNATMAFDLAQTTKH